MSDSPVAELNEEFDSDDVAHLKELCKTDLYFLAKGVLGYDQLEEGAHGALCSFMVHEPSSRRMVLMPRGFLKSTICTISDSIRLSLINPNIRILIQNEVLGNAENFLHELKQHWVKNMLLRSWFPELVPEKFVGAGTDWSSISASLNRTSIAKESTYTASGSGGSPQSQHFEVIKNDDLIGEKAKESEVEMKKAIRWSNAMLPLLDRMSGRIDYYATRKTIIDVYAHVQEMYKRRIKVFIREPIENGDTIFTKVPLEELQHIMTDTPDLWAYDYMNNPMGEGGTDWNENLIQYFEITADRRVVFKDPFTGERQAWNISELYIVITVDPNAGRVTSPDKAAIVVHGVSPLDQIFILETWDGRPTPGDLNLQILMLAGQWHPVTIGIEEAGQQTTIYWLEQQMAKDRTYYNIKPTKHGNKDKATRIRQGLDAPLKAKRFFVQAHQMTLITQIKMHPQLAAHNWDSIDCCAQGPQVYQTGTDEESLKKDEEAEKKVLEFRGQTGYGNSVRRTRVGAASLKPWA